MSRSRTCWRNTPGAIRTRPPSSIWNPAPPSISASSTASPSTSRPISRARASRKGSRVLVLSDECLEKLLIWFGVWRIGAVICPFNLEINEKQMVSLTAALKPALILYHKEIDVAAMVGDAPAERVRFGAWSAGRRERPAGRAVRGAAARRRGATARAQRRRRHRLHLLHLGHHGAAEDRHLQPRRLLDERPRHPGIPRPHRGRPHPGIPLVRLELGAGVEPAAVPAEGADHAHRQAVLAQPLLRMDAETRHHLFGRRADGAQHPAEQADRLHREGRADPAADELLDRAA